MADRNLIIYCDESIEKGRHYSHFYGGALIDASRREAISTRLSDVKAEQFLGAELKWSKITASYADKYIAFIDEFFDLIGEGEIKVRIMFTQNVNRAVNLTDYQINNQYFLLYYQLIKHAFGLMHCGDVRRETRVSLYLDDIPDKSDNYQSFKNYVATLSQFPKFVAQGVFIPIDEITDINSREHVILQGLDIILGSMQFRLNDKHKDIPEGKKRRAKRTVAKERVYKHINARIRAIYPNFNIGVSTGTQDDLTNRWRHPYRHWLFVPSEYDRAPDASKRKKR